MAGAYAYIKAHERELTGKRVAILCADSIRNYMSKFLDDDWMKSKGFTVENQDSAESPSAELSSKVLQKRLRELEGAHAKGLVSTSDVDRIRAELLKRYKK